MPSGQTGGYLSVTPPRAFGRSRLMAPTNLFPRRHCTTLPYCGWRKIPGVGFSSPRKDFAVGTEAAISEFAPNLDDFIRKKVLISASRSPRGELGLGTFYGGLAIVSPSGSLERILTIDDGMPSRSIYSLFFANDGALWTTSGVGIGQIWLNAGTTLFDAKQGLAGKQCISIAQSGSAILVSTEEGVFGLPISDDGSAQFQPIPKLSGRYTDLDRGTPMARSMHRASSESTGLIPLE